ncbi:1-phosphatidylinositol 4,5-bisphosphate phosphodiesterase eta-2 isoform X9 [Athene cunicularia]|uniref:1-phosphatidylinositol 4,5-bisphosphate phosphodiesterase eta-2 isoform X9 n=1 Tax=Athene cunicularia TaxID=194338 RepID=UPI000EF75021|nr:1-phosphatidylinositol 4,5-bisphosphate phosphodiesterase eta-2 isoform X9 [Athene cunicularia]
MDASKSPLLQNKFSVARLAEEFFWVGGSIVASPKWKIGHIVERCMSSMQTGTQMIKLRGSTKGLVRFYYLDEHKSCIRWRPSRKNEKAKISIDSIQEVCEGKQSEIFQRYADGSFDPNCCFSIYYGDHMESLDLVSSSGEEARTWITGLKYLMAGISDEDSLSKRQRTRDQWLKQTFDEADKNGDGSLSISEVLQLMHKLNVNLPRQKVKQMFKEADTDENQGTLGFDEFCAFYKMMSTRRDLYLLMLTYSNHKDHLDTDDLRRFLETEQKMTNVTKEHCLEIISKFEPCLENKKEGALGIDGFTNYMRSPSGDIFNPEHYQVNQDMSYPLSHYFITSSHNTYLMGDQLMSQSRVDMYAWVLQSGCRCVEVDCWDGPDGEPIVHHGYTLTSKILFKDVIETINKYAFIKNEYPVILSIENHCSVIQQKKMAQYLTEILGDKLDLSSVHSDDSTTLPSPASLKGKILVKGKKLPANISDDAEEGEVSDEDSADEIDDDCKIMNGDNKLEDDVEPGEDFSTNKRHSRSLMGSFSKRKKKGSKLKKATSLEEGEDDSDSQANLARSSVHYSRVNRQKKTMKLSRALSDLVKYTKSVGIHDVETEISSSWQVSSFSETKAHQILQQKPAQYLRFNQHQLSRIYPSSYRVDSSNYNPQPFWNAGCQLVALNYQSEGRMLQLNRAKFSANGNCGYVLKPNCMCQGVFNPNSEDPLPGQLKKQLVLRIISGQQLPKPRDSMLGDRGEIIDPFVEVEVIGLPVDCFKEQTRVVDDNGFNPMWEETLVFTVHMPEIALIRFLVWDHDPIGRDFIGQRTIAFSSMMPGYRHVYLEGMEEASIFVHVAINDICGKAKQALGLKGLFLRNPKQASLDSHAAGQLHRKHSFSSHILRRTASAPTKSQKKNKKGFPEIAFDTKDNSSEGAAEDREVEAASQPRFEQEPESASLSPAPRDGASGEVHGKGLKDVCHFSMQRSVTSLCSLETITEEPVIANENHHASLFFPLPITPYSDSEEGSMSDHSTESRSEASSTSTQPQESLLTREQRTNLAAEDQVQVATRAADTSLVRQEDERTSVAGCLTEANGWTQACRKAEERHGLAVQPQEAWLVVAAGNAAGQPAENCQQQRDRPGQVLRDVKSTADSKGQKFGAAAVLLQQTNVINSTQTTLPPDTSQKAQAAQALPVSLSQTSSYMLVRRSKSEGLKMTDSSALIKIPSSLSPAAEVYFDATVNDRIWSKLDCSNHRDSMSSSSSMSSNDTVIDLSLPNLARKSLPDLGIRHDNLEPLAIRKGVRPRSATTSCNEMPMVSKSKSNPNLRSGQLPADELCPRPLARSPPDAFSSIPRRHTWSRLYIESLRQSSNKSKSHDMVGNNQAKSKSLGDLTSDDIVCTFESKYRSISRSFVTRSMREQRRSSGLRSSGKAQDELTEQLKKLTAFQQENDITSPISLDPTESEEEGESLGLLRRSSSRSQSRVRYIANRAKQAQERQRLQSLGQLSGSPIEERGNPEGACSVAKALCMDIASPAVFTAQPKNQTDYNADTEVFFMLKL